MCKHQNESGTKTFWIRHQSGNFCSSVNVVLNSLFPPNAYAGYLFQSWGKEIVGGQNLQIMTAFSFISKLVQFVFQYCLQFNDDIMASGSSDSTVRPSSGYVSGIEKYFFSYLLRQPTTDQNRAKQSLQSLFSI